MVLGKLDINMKKKELYPYLTPYAKIKLKWIKHLSVRTKAVKHVFILFFVHVACKISESTRELPAIGLLAWAPEVKGHNPNTRALGSSQL